ncbi:MAG: hypothetical protein ABFC89_10650 [Methanospirillum sp.]
MRSFLLLDRDLSVHYIPSESTAGLLPRLAEIVNLRESGPADALCIRLVSSEEWERDRPTSTAERTVLPVHPWLRVWHDGSRDYHFVLSFPYGEVSGGPPSYVGYLSMILGATFLLLSDRVTLLHGALVERDGLASVLIGTGGAGKTTAARRIGPPWRAVSDDMVAVVRGSDGTYHAHGLPTWSAWLEPNEDRALGRYVDINEGYPLRAVYVIEQSPDDALLAVPLSEGVDAVVKSSFEVYSRFWQRFSFEEKLRRKRELLLGARGILLAVDHAVLRISREGEFWRLMA